MAESKSKPEDVGLGGPTLRKVRESPLDVPFGTQPRRPAWPLAALIIVFTLWFAFLVWMAVQYPAR